MTITKMQCLTFALACTLLAGCAGEDPAVAAAAAAEEAAARDEKANEGADAFDAAARSGNWALAKAQADVLMHDYPDSDAAKRVGAEYEGVKQKLEDSRETARTAALWSYSTQAVKGGEQRSSAIYAKDNVDVDGRGPSQVRLIFRDHPSWGRSSYLVLQAGDFDCYRGCKVQVKVDDKPAKALPGSRPDTDEAIAMFIEDERALWKLATGAKTLEIEFPVKGLGKRTAFFEVGGLDASRMPGW